MPVLNDGLTVSQVAVTQAGAGSTDLVAAPGANMLIHVVAIVLVGDVAGTVKFTEGTGPTDLTGVIPLGATGGFVVISASPKTPVLSTVTANSKLSLVSSTAKVFGWVRYFVEPTR